ncbi:MAG TPA: DUF2281 domain-containing protein [Chloroflexota bacterium]|nr:DUF2281 domain-containing protein [Chloroflexota bacterium]
MTLYDVTITKIRQLPEPLIQEVNDFVDFLLIKNNPTRWDLWSQIHENLDMAESDMSDYLTQLEEYEERLARGEIQW